MCSLTGGTHSVHGLSQVSLQIQQLVSNLPRPLGISRDCKRREFARPEFTPARLEKELPRGRSAEVADDAQVWDDLRFDHAGALAAIATLAAPLPAQPGELRQRPAARQAGKRSLEVR